MKRPNRAISEAAYERIAREDRPKVGVLPTTHPLNPDKYNILAIIHDRISACEEYRVLQPLQELEKRGHNIWIINGTLLASRLARGIDDFKGADLVLVNRIMAPGEDAAGYSQQMVELRKRGTASICDFDDDFRNQYRVVHDGVLPDLKGFSAITVTTPELRAQYGGENKHIYVLPNMIQTWRTQGHLRDIGHLTIGLSGNITHKEDWVVVIQPLLHILHDYPAVRLFVSGYLPPEFVGHPQVLTPGTVKPEYVIDGNLLVPYSKYFWLMQNTDILLVPVVDTDRFNWGKSPLKVLEGWSAARDVEGMQGGCCVIATGGKLPIYRSVITHMQDGILVEHNSEAWESAIRQVLDNGLLMRSLQVNGHLTSFGYRSDGQWLNEREQIYATVIERERRRKK